MHSWVFRNREELARIYGLDRSPRASAKPALPAAADRDGAAAARVVPMASAGSQTPPKRIEPQQAQRSKAQSPPRLPLARLVRFVLRPLPRAR